MSPTPTSTMFSSTYIRFIRNSATSNKDTDDCVTIKRTGVGQYELTYTNTNTDSGKPDNYTIPKDDKDVFRWFRSIIGLLEADMEPFRQVQIDFPAAPSIMFDARHIGDHYHTILNALEIWLDDKISAENPPKTPSRRTQPVAPCAPLRQNRHHMFFDLGDGHDE